MMDFLENARRYLWAFVEIAFLVVLAILLIHIILGEGAGGFVASVADNVQKFVAGTPTPSLVGLALLLAIIVLIKRRLS
jgi:flagellar biosynthesis protein FliR